VSPHLVFRLAVDQEDAPPVEIDTVLLHVQIRIEPQLRKYDVPTRMRLFDLFGEPEQWSRTLHGMLWTHADVVVPRFTGRTTVTLHVPCTFDFNIAATRYFDGLTEGDVPLTLLFSGIDLIPGVDLIPFATLTLVKEIAKAWREGEFREPVVVTGPIIDAKTTTSGQP